MGNWFCKRTPQRVIIQGLDAAGKTSLLYRMKLGEVVTTIPTIGFNVETINTGGLTIICWDLGGRDKIRPLYRHYYSGTQGFVYVIDSADRDRLEDALGELVRFVFLEEESAGCVVMILANKQDIPGAMAALQIQEALNEKYKVSRSSPSSHTVFVRPCSVVTGDGIFEAFEEFSEQLKLKEMGKLLPGLLPLRAAQDVPKPDALTSSKTIGNDENKESVALAYAKTFLRNKVSFIKSMLFKIEH